MSVQMLPPVRMPQLSGGRERAKALLAPIRAELRNRQIRLDCRSLVAGTSSFADELVTIVLVDGGASELVIEYAGEDFSQHLLDAASDHGVSDRVTFL